MRKSNKKQLLKGRKSKKKFYSAQKNQNSDIGKVEVVLRTIKKHNLNKLKITNDASDYLFSCLSKGKVISLMSIKKTFKENKLLKKKLIKLADRNQYLENYNQKIEEEYHKLGENERYLIDELRKEQEKISKQSLQSQQLKSEICQLKEDNQELKKTL